MARDVASWCVHIAHNAIQLARVPEAWPMPMSLGDDALACSARPVAPTRGTVPRAKRMARYFEDHNGRSRTSVLMDEYGATAGMMPLGFPVGNTVAGDCRRVSAAAAKVARDRGWL